jgi:urease accessory protein
LAALYAFAVGLLGASMRLIRVDHVQTQSILARLRPHLIRVVDAHVDTPLEEMRSWTPLIDIMAMRHEQAHVRLFIS